MINKERLKNIAEEGTAVPLTKEQIDQVFDFIDSAGERGVSGREILAFIRDEFDVPPNNQGPTFDLVMAQLQKAGEVEAFSRKYGSTKKKVA